MAKSGLVKNRVAHQLQEWKRNMAKGIGIAGFTLILVSVFLPVGVNLFALWLALILCTIAAFGGDKVYSIASIIVGAATLIFLSPLTLLALAVGAESQNPNAAPMLGITIVLFCLPIAVMIFRGFSKKQSDKP